MFDEENITTMAKKKEQKYLQRSDIPDTSDKLVSKNTILEEMKSIENCFVLCGYAEKGWWRIKEFIEKL